MKFLTRSIKAAVLLVLLLAPASQSPIVAQAEVKKGKYAPPPVASAEMVKSYIEAVKASDFFKNATALTPEEAETLAPQWNVLNPAGVVVKKVSLLMHLQDMDIEVADEYWVLRYDSVELADGIYRQALFIHALKRDKYEVAPADLKSLDIDILAYILVRHPLNLVLASHDVDNEPLTSVVATLCKQAKVGYSIRADIANEQFISQKTTNLTVYESLSLLAEAAGWTIDISGGSFDDDIHDNLYDIEDHGDMGIELGSVLEVYRSRGVINVFESPEKPINTQLDALNHLVSKAIANNDSRKTVVLLTID